MKAGILFTGTGPILILTSYDSLKNRKLVGRLQSKGIRKFIAYEVPLAGVRKKYGAHYDVTMSDLKQQDDLRVLDEDGNHIFLEFSLKQLHKPVCHDS